MKTENKKKRIFPTWDSYVIKRFKGDQEFFKRSIASSFKEYIKTNDDFLLRETLKQAAAAKGITQLAKETGLSRQYLYEMLSEKGNPTLATFRAVLQALGFKMYVRAIKPI